MEAEAEVLIPDVILPASPRHIDVIGAGRGTQAILDVLEERQRAEPSTSIRLFEPRVAKGTELVKEARIRGVELTLRPRRAEDSVAHETRLGDLVLVHADDPATTASLLANRALVGSPILSQFLLGWNYGRQIAGIRIAAARFDEETRRAGVALTHRLAELRARSGSSAILEQPAWSAIEQPIRQWMRDAVTREADRLDAGVIAESDPIEATFDGFTTSPVLVVETDEVVSNEHLVLSAVEDALAERTFQRGTTILVAEVPRASRLLFLHEARLRFDGRLELVRTESLDSDSFRRPGRDAASGPGLLAFFAALAGIVLLATITPTNPMAFTD